MSFKSQVSNLLKAHREIHMKDKYRTIPSPYHSGISNQELVHCMKEVSDLVLSPNFVVIINDDESEYETIEKFEVLR